MSIGYMEPIYLALLADVILMCIRGFRNVLGLPIMVEVDDTVDRYRPKSTLTFSSSTQLMVASIWT